MFTDREQLTQLKISSRDHSIAVMGLTEEGEEESLKVLTGNHGWSDVYLPSRPHCIKTDSIVTSKTNNLEAVRFSLISACMLLPEETLEDGEDLSLQKT